MTWQGRRVLVTGAGGFIGSHLAERLVQLGAKTRALVHYRADGSRGWLEQSPLKDELEVTAGDIRDRDSVLQVMKGVDVVFHLAALIAIPHSYDVPESFMETNVRGTLNVLQAARQCRVERLVHTSTSEVYGTAQYVPIDESHSLQGQSPYAATKIGADKMAEAFWLSFGLPVATVRPFNTFGPRQSARAIVPTIVTQCLTSDVVRLGHLHPTRDMNYVADIVEGFVLAASSSDAVGRTINLGSGREIQIEALARMIAQLIGRDIAVERQEERVRPEPSEVDRLLADNRVARDVLGWRPAVSLEDGLQMTIEWFRAHLDEYRPGVYAV
jgi:dTDP-glucose 4,6-dehydratase